MDINELRKTYPDFTIEVTPMPNLATRFSFNVKIDGEEYYNSITGNSSTTLIQFEEMLILAQKNLFNATLQENL